MVQDIRGKYGSAGDYDSVWREPEDYRKAIQRVYHAPGQASFIELPVVTSA